MSIRIDGTNTTANPGITGGDADTGLQFGTDQVSIVTGGVERAKVDDVGRFDVNSGSSGVISAKQNTNNGGFNIYEGKDSTGSTKFYVSHNGRVGAAEGVIFGTDTAADNVLDDYEEGTFTPAVSGSASIGVAEGRYTKIGNRVYFNLYVQVSALPSSANLELLNLPFASGANNQAYSSYGRGWTNDWAANANNLQWLHAPGATAIVAFTTSASGSVVPLNTSSIGTGGNVILTGQYKID